MPAPLRVKLNTEEDRTRRELSSANDVPVRVKQRAVALRLNARGWNVPLIIDISQIEIIRDALLYNIIIARMKDK